MPQRRQLSWTELRVGVFVVVGLFILAVGIFYVTGPAILGPKYILRTYLPEVSGLAVGAPVRLDGVDLGNVQAIRMAPRPRTGAFDPNRNIEVVMRVDRRYQNDILTDSVASLVTEGLLGNRYVNITRGYTGVPLANGQEVKGIEEKAMKEVVERSADVLGNLQALSEDIRDLIAGVQRGRGTLGKFLTDEQVYDHLNGVLGKSDQLLAGIQAGQGTVGKIVASDEMYQKAYDAVNRADSIIANVQDQKGTVGKLIYDPSVYQNLNQSLEKSNALLTDVRAGKGTLGKLATDESLYTHVRDTSANLAAATAKLNENTTTAGKIFTDPQMYDNLSGLAGDMRLLVGDFRRDPKKFLHIKLSIF